VISEGEAVTFAAESDYDLSALTWTSSLNGDLGTGASITRGSLSVGTHEMTVSYYASVLGIEFASLEVASFSIKSPLDGKAVALGESVSHLRLTVILICHQLIERRILTVT
jgi:hypothetical protein